MDTYQIFYLVYFTIASVITCIHYLNKGFNITRLFNALSSVIAITILYLGGFFEQVEFWQMTYIVLFVLAIVGLFLPKKVYNELDSLNKDAIQRNPIFLVIGIVLSLFIVYMGGFFS